MKKRSGLFSYISRSGFVRSVFFRVLAIFITVSIVITAIVFISFTSEVSRSTVLDRQKQLALVESTISARMSEVTSIAYNIGTDSDFLLEPVTSSGYTGYKMSSTLERYLVGNSFIEHLAFYRLSEPDTIYVSSGVRSLSEFFSSSFGMSDEAAQQNIRAISTSTTATVKAITYGDEKNTFFACLYPLPQLSLQPKAFVLVLIPANKVTPLFGTLLESPSAELAVFDADKQLIYHGGNDNGLTLEDYTDPDTLSEQRVRCDGKNYSVQKQVSDTNGWTYVSAIKVSDTLFGLAAKQVVFIVLLLVVLFVTVVVMLASIIAQYKPISKLAFEVNPGKEDAVVDERELLTSTLATLKDDSAQKQKYETAYYEAEAANKAKSAFLSSMSHDIRTPLNAVIGMSELALKHADDPAYVRDCLEKVRTSSRYLLDIINNVLDMSRIESGRFSIAREKVDLAVLIDGVQSMVAQSVKDKSLSFTVDTHIAHRFVLGDSLRLMQVFINILSNSVKFTPPSGELSLTVTETQCAHGDTAVYVFVFSDNGIGMSEEFVGSVFDTFSRADGSMTSRSEGTGLGMAIAKNLVELMGGTIECQSKLGSGTVFTVTLSMPVCDASASDAVRDYSRAHATGEIDLLGKRILLVEDNAINMEIASRIIAETGAEITQAYNGKEAVDEFSAHPEGYFDLILMDLQMPVMNGFEATALIRGMDRADAKSVIIYAMTANTFDEDVRQVRESGMDGHIGKPYTPDSLCKVLFEVLDQ